MTRAVQIQRLDTSEMIDSLTQLVGSQKGRLKEIVDGLKPAVKLESVALTSAYQRLNFNYQVRRNRVYVVRIGGYIETPVLENSLQIAIAKTTEADFIVLQVHGSVPTSDTTLGNVEPLTQGGYVGFNIDPVGSKSITSFAVTGVFQADSYDGIASFYAKGDGIGLAAGMHVEFYEVGPLSTLLAKE